MTMKPVNSCQSIAALWHKSSVGWLSDIGVSICETADESGFSVRRRRPHRMHKNGAVRKSQSAETAGDGRRHRRRTVLHCNCAVGADRKRREDLWRRRGRQRRPSADGLRMAQSNADLQNGRFRDLFGRACCVRPINYPISRQTRP